MDLGLRGKVALVTGGSHGIGRSIALLLATEGCNVAICARDSDRPGYSGMVAATASEIRSKGVEALGIRFDAHEPGATGRVLDAVIEKWGTIHVLINNVGGGGRWGNPTVEASEERVWLDVYEKNAMSAVRFTVAAIPHMRRQKWGRVVTITSTYGREGGGRPWFNMAKIAQTTLMKNLGMNSDLARDGITFNSVAPGSIMIPDTGWEAEQKQDPAEFDRMVGKRFPMGRLGTPEEVAAVVVFVCSEAASLVNGAAIGVDGGESRCL